jgi:predicted nucleic acid-binding Zn ribbon protein
VTEPAQKRRCPTCGLPLPEDAFYANCGECKDCKRQRSQRNRAEQARKIAAFERFVDVLVDLASKAVA